MNINQLLKHNFFKKACQRSKIKNEIGHLIRKTECRINSSLLAPICFSSNLEIEKMSTSETKFDYNPNISTSEDKKPIVNTTPAVISCDTSLVLENIEQEKVNDYEVQPLPAMQVNIEQINGNISSRIRHISFSASDSNSELNDETTSPANKETMPDQMGRFNVEVLNNHHSHSGSGAYENSLSSISEEHQDQHPHNIDSDDDEQENEQQTKSTMYGRFAVAKGNTPSTSNYSNTHEMNFNDDNVNRNTPALNHNITDSPPVLMSNALPVIPLVVDEKAVIKWSVDHCSAWLSTLGAAYVQYQEKFISNGIDGVLMKSLDDEMLKEIVPSKLHRTKIILSAKLLFPSAGNGSVYESSL